MDTRKLVGWLVLFTSAFGALAGLYLIITTTSLVAGSAWFTSNTVRPTANFHASPRSQNLALDTPTTYYVAKGGNNGDGLSWASAWNELNQIKWSVIMPGDTILIDGGTSSMSYTTTLTAGKDGTATAPITIRLASESGRNGQVRIFGGRATPLPYCGQATYSYETTAREVGINLMGRSYITVDGVKWRGITISGHNVNGVRLSDLSNTITLRNLEIYDNGRAYQSNGVWYPDYPGIQISGPNHVFERLIIHDNGQDAIQQYYRGKVSNFTLRKSWLYNARKDPQGGMWNFCTHNDGFQIYAGGATSGLLFEDSIIGPGLSSGLILGDPNEDTRANNVTIRHVLFYGSGNSTQWAQNIHDGNSVTPPTGWLLENVTSDRGDFNSSNIEWWHNTSHPGLTIRNSIFTGGRNMAVSTGGTYSGNIQYNAQGVNPNVGANINPQYADATVYGTSRLDVDFRLASTSPALGKGSRITSVTQLLQDGDHNG